MMSEEIILTIKQACDGLYVCEAHFIKEPAARIFHPHGICQTRKYEPVIVCVQVKGYSKSKKLPEFRNLPLEKCESVKLLKQKFKIHPKFNPLDEQYVDWMFHV